MTLDLRSAAIELLKRADIESSEVHSVDGLLERYDEQDHKLVECKFPATSPWWRGEIERFMRSGKPRWIARVGRRGGKSSTISRLCVAWALHGDWVVPPGDVAVVAFVSVDRMEAAGRIDTIRQILSALQVPFAQRDGELEIGAGARRVIFRVKACTLRSVIGFTAIAVACDEVAKWRDNDSGANPAEGVISSLAPTMATVLNSWMFVGSSPWTEDDYHARQFDLGETDAQQVSWAPTWVAHPALTEERTRKLEPDPETHKREYGAIPSNGITENWFGESVQRALTNESPPKHPGTKYYIAIDPAFIRDHFGWAVVASHRIDGQRVTWVHAVGDWDPKGRMPSELADRVKTELCDVYGTTTVYSDQHEGSSFGELCKRSGFHLVIELADKLTEYKSVRTAMLEGTFLAPLDDELVRDFRKIRGVYTDTGRERIEVAHDERGHADRISALVKAGAIALARRANELPGPSAPAEGTPEWYRQEADREREEARARSAKRQKQAFRERGWRGVLK